MKWKEENSLLSEPPAGGREVKTAFDKEREQRIRENQNYWKAIQTPEFRRAARRIREYADAMFEQWRQNPTQKWPGLK